MVPCAFDIYTWRQIDIVVVHLAGFAPMIALYRNSPPKSAPSSCHQANRRALRQQFAFVFGDSRTVYIHAITTDFSDTTDQFMGNTGLSGLSRTAQDHRIAVFVGAHKRVDQHLFAVYYVFGWHGATNRKCPLEWRNDLSTFLSMSQNPRPYVSKSETLCLKIRDIYPVLIIGNCQKVKRAEKAI